MSDLIRRDDVDPRNLANPRKLNGVPYTDYERGYNDGIIDAYWLTRGAKAVEAEPVVHARWEFEHIQQIAPNCSNCGMQSIMAYPNCPYCRAKMENGREPKNED